MKLKRTKSKKNCIIYWIICKSLVFFFLCFHVQREIWSHFVLAYVDFWLTKDQKLKSRFPFEISTSIESNQITFVSFNSHFEITTIKVSPMNPFDTLIFCSIHNLNAWQTTRALCFHFTLCFFELLRTFSFFSLFGHFYC